MNAPHDNASARYFAEDFHSPERHYLDLLNAVLLTGDRREGRNGGTRSLFGAQMRFDLATGFPLLTTKKVHWKAIVVELLWFLTGSTNTRYMDEHGVTIWDEWKDENGELGPVYGHQWRFWTAASKAIPVTLGDGMIQNMFGTHDQLAKVIADLKSDPYSRRHIVSAWNVDEIDLMALPPCHVMYQFHVAKGRLNCHLYQRSGDMFLGVPFNIASYALLTHLVAREVGLEPGELVHSLGDYHLYENHVEQAREQLSRRPRYLPTLNLPPLSYGSMFALAPKDIQIENYHPYPAIRAEVSK